MKVSEAKALVLGLMERDLRRSRAAVLVDAASPDPSDPGKFLIDGKPARVIHHFSGWHVPIDLGWFHGGFEPPRIQKGAFHWYAFAIPSLRARRADHYFVCDRLQMRARVLEFAAPRGNDHRDHADWRCDFRVYPGE